jgi:predicted acetyltransferase
MSASKLVRPDADYKESYLAALKEYHAEGRYLYVCHSTIANNFDHYVNQLRLERGCPHQPFQNWVEPVPETVVWLVKDDEYIGTVQIRHRVNWHLEKWGGHIHFIVRPSMRNKGWGRKMLIKTIPVANYLGLEKMLLTACPDNHFAKRMIESCGGIFEDELPETEKFPARDTYWIDCT